MSERILIVRLSAIGDVVFASPLIAATRRRYPEARISWLVEAPAAPLIREHPDLAEVIIWDKGLWKTLWRERRYGRLLREILAFRKALRSRGFTTVFEIQGLFKSAFLAWLTGAPERIGFRGREKQGWMLTRQLDKRNDSMRIGREYLGFAEDVGLVTETFDMHVALSDADRAYAESERDQGQYLVICPFTTRPQKHWFDHHWRALVEALQARYGWRVIMLGGPGDCDHAATLSDGTPIESRVGQCSLRESAALIERASLLIGVDTGLTHMGIAFNVPTVALFGSTCPYQDTTRDNARVIYHALSCSPCRRRPTCDGRFDCLLAITPDEVLATCAELPDLPAQC